jgi:hypothetical protein
MSTEAEEQAERREVLRNDQRVREQGATYHGFTHSDLGGCFALAEGRAQLLVKASLRPIRRDCYIYAVEAARPPVSLGNPHPADPNCYTSQHC